MKFRATTFLGVFSIRNGCIVACITQIIIGILLWASLKYLRPMLQVFNIVVMVYIISGAILGLYGVWKRSEIITWLYLIHLGSCATLVFLIAVDFAGIMHILPKPPVAPSVPIVPPVLERLEKLTEEVESSIPFVGSGSETLKKKAQPAFMRPTITDTFHATLRKARNFTRGKKRHLSIVNTKHYSDFTKLNDSMVNSETEEKKPDPASVAVPQILQTEGQSEEVSRDEIPPEVVGLPVDLQKQVSATTKVIKHVVKFAFSGAFAVLFVFQIYCSYVVFTFVLNKCTSLDELVDQPVRLFSFNNLQEQFEPIFQGSSISTITDLDPNGERNPLTETILARA